MCLQPQISTDDQRWIYTFRNVKINNKLSLLNQEVIFTGTSLSKEIKIGIFTYKTSIKKEGESFTVIFTEIKCEDD